MEKFNYNEAKDVAMKLGLVAGGMWLVSFYGFVYSFPSGMAELSYLLGMASVPVIGMKLRRIRSVVEGMSLMNAWWVAWFTFMCAMLLTTAGQYIYFGWLDNGRLVEGILTLLQDEQVVKVYSEAGGAEMLSQLTEGVKSLSEVGIRELVMSFMSSNMMIGLIASILTALMTIGTKKIENNGYNGISPTV